MTRAFIELLHTQQIRTVNGRLYNSSQLLRTIRDSGVGNFNQYQGILFSNCERLFTVGDLEIDDILSQVGIVFSFLGVLPDARLEMIIRNRDGDLQPNQPLSTIEPNMYFHLPDIPIEINTIHGAKGQTHQATLVLETYYYQSDLVTILPYLTGRNIQNPRTRVLTRFLPLTYVSCTRPSHLLCLAIQKDHINADQQNQLLEFGWRIDENLVIV